jgi:hypothetical protein
MCSRTSSAKTNNPAKTDKNGSAASTLSPRAKTSPIEQVRAASPVLDGKRSIKQSSTPAMWRPWFAPQFELVAA